ncbi:unnamed protein product [Absidia cylindrospora]
MVLHNLSSTTPPQFCPSISGNSRLPRHSRLVIQAPAFRTNTPNQASSLLIYKHTCTSLTNEERELVFGGT